MVLDLVFVAYVLLMAFVGFRTGLFRRILHFGAFYAAMFLARGLSPGGTQALGYSTGPYPVAAHFGVYLGILAGIVLLVEGLGVVYRGPLHFFNAMVFDRALGAAAGAVLAVMELAVIVYLFSNMIGTTGPAGSGQAPIATSAAASLSRSIVARGLDRVREPTLLVFHPVLPEEPGRFFASSFN